jgi:thioredoxin reductase
MNTVETDVLIVGAGPSGLAAAIELRRLGIERVLLVDREQQAGGIPRHCHHTGFGIGDLRRVLSGPAYAARYVQMAVRSGATIQTETTLTNWKGGTTLSATSPAGLSEIHAQAVILATGCRERPRSARLVPGSRPQGIFTTGMLQNYVERNQPIGIQAVIVGAEHVSFSAAMTLHHVGLSAIIVTDLPHHQTYLPYKLIGADLRLIPVHTHTRLSNILGRQRVEAVELTDVRSGKTRMLECDTIVFTGDWIPDHELARVGGLTLDAGTRGPQVDMTLHTSEPGVFAAGNLIHAAETADVAALSGRYAARAVNEYLHSSQQSGPVIPIQVEAPLTWISPNAIRRGQSSAPHGHFILRVCQFLTLPGVEVWQGSRLLWQQRYLRLTPNLPVHLKDGWLNQVDFSGDTIRVVVSEG